MIGGRIMFVGEDSVFFGGIFLFFEEDYCLRDRISGIF